MLTQQIPLTLILTLISYANLHTSLKNAFRIGLAFFSLCIWLLTLTGDLGLGELGLGFELGAARLLEWLTTEVEGKGIMVQTRNRVKESGLVLK